MCEICDKNPKNRCVLGRFRLVRLIFALLNIHIFDEILQRDRIEFYLYNL